MKMDSCPHAFFYVFLAFFMMMWNVKASVEDQCNLFKGNWVQDESYPLYDSASCPFIATQFDCLKNDRPDKMYLKYKWKPDGYDLPMFNGTDLVERMRGKHIIFVGDSISKNQRNSFLCMLYGAIPDAKTIISNHGFVHTVKFEDYNVSVSNHFTSLLVDIVEETTGRILKLDSMQQGGPIWLSADILVFNTFLWWYRSDSHQPWDYVQDGNAVRKDMNRTEAFSKGLATWARWVDSNIDPKTKKVFYLGIPPNHHRGDQWGEPGKSCLGQTQPLEAREYPGGPIPQESIVHDVLEKMSRPVHLLDITFLSQLRKDGHVSKYDGSNGTHIDCTHWCLAGVPDTWNLLLNAALLEQK